MNDKKRGNLIILEGLDRCGKTTQVQNLVDWINSLEGMTAEAVKFPG